MSNIREKITQILIECEKDVSHGKAVERIVSEIINTPHTVVFDESVKMEMRHHLERWGDEEGVPPHHFALVLTMINGKIAKAILERDWSKFEHHLITLAAVSGTFHKYLYRLNSQVNIWFTKK